jgi:signal transduction histidine kinase
VRRRRAQRQRQALELHDNIVQGLVAIHWALEAGDVEQARAATSATLAQAQQMIGGLLGDELAFVPGSLRRDVATAPLEGAGPAAPDGGH